MQSLQGCLGIPGRAGESVIISAGLTTQYTPTGGTAVLYDTVITDPLNCYNKANGNINIPSNGLYLISAGGNCTTGDTVYYLVKSGSSPTGNLIILFDGGLSATANCAGSVCLLLAAGDALNIAQNSAHPLTAKNSNGYANWFSVAKVGHL